MTVGAGTKVQTETMKRAMELLPIIAADISISKEVLAEKSGRSIATLYRHLRALESGGYLVFSQGRIALREGLDQPFSETIKMFSAGDKILIRVMRDTEIRVRQVAGRGLEIELMPTVGERKS